MNFGFMTFDGTRGLIIGDYIRPKTGTYAGQLGPWSKVVSTAGINPESNLMKGLFILWGMTGLICTLCFALGVSWAWKGMLIINIFSLWYLVPGTGLSAVQIILLLLLKFMK